MFGSASLGGYRLTDEERAGGLVAFQQLVDVTARCIDAGVLAASRPPWPASSGSGCTAT